MTGFGNYSKATKIAMKVDKRIAGANIDKRIARDIGKFNKRTKGLKI